MQISRYPDIQIENGFFKFLEDPKKPTICEIRQRFEMIHRILRWNTPFFIPTENNNARIRLKKVASDLYELVVKKNRMRPKSKNMTAAKKSYQEIKAFSVPKEFLPITADLVKKLFGLLSFKDIIATATVSIQNYKIVYLQAILRARVYNYKGKSLLGAINHMKMVVKLSLSMHGKVPPKNLQLQQDPDGLFAKISYDHGFDVFTPVSKENFLRFVRSDRFLVVKKLLKEGISKELIQTAFQQAVVNRSLEITELLLLEGADATKMDPPFFSLRMQEAYPIVALLLKYGWNPNMQDNTGRTLLHHTVFHGTISTMQLLLENGADPNIQDNMGKTPIFEISAFNLTMKYVKPLLDHGADPFIQDDHHALFLNFWEKPTPNTSELIFEHFCNLNLKK